MSEHACMQSASHSISHADMVLLLWSSRSPPHHAMLACPPLLTRSSSVVLLPAGNRATVRLLALLALPLQMLRRPSRPLPTPPLLPPGSLRPLPHRLRRPRMPLASLLLMPPAPTLPAPATTPPPLVPALPTSCNAASFACRRTSAATLPRWRSAKSTRSGAPAPIAVTQLTRNIGMPIGI